MKARNFPRFSLLAGVGNGEKMVKLADFGMAKRATPSMAWVKKR